MAGKFPGWKPEAVVAVAPFQAWGSECLGPSFGSAVARHLTRALGQLPGIHVISYDSMMRYVSAAIPVQRIGAEVGARYVVRGQIIGLGDDNLEYRAALIDARSSEQMAQVVQASTFDACLDLQGAIILRLMQPLERAIRLAELKPVVLPTTRHRLALERVENAIAAILSLDVGEFNRAERWLGEAVRLDPGYALAWAWLARWHSLRVGQGWAKDRDTEARLAREKAERAIALDPHSASALATLGHIHSYLFKDGKAAQRQFRKALSVDVNHALSWALSSLTETYVGRASEGRSRIERALVLSPHDPMTYAFQNYAVIACWAAGDFLAAEGYARGSLRLNPNFSATLRMLAAVLESQGRRDEAAAVAAQHRSLMPGFKGESAPFLSKRLNALLLRQWRRAGLIEA